MQKAKRWVMRAKQDVILETYDFDETQLKPREVAVRVDWTAVSPGTECANYLALDPDVWRADSWCPYPWHAGYAGVGHVMAAGTEVTEYAVGDRVVGGMTHGTHWRGDVDQLMIPAHPAVAPEHAAYTQIIAICVTALQVLDKSVDAFETAGVWGQGTIGNLTAQVLQRAGYRVVGIDPLAQRRELAQQCGIREVLDPAATDFAAQVAEITHGDGFDVGVDTTGAAPVTIHIPQYLRLRGQLVLMTHWRSQPVIDASPFIHTVFWNGITVHGAHTRTPGREPWGDWLALQRRKWTKIQHELATGGIAVEPLISHRVRPDACKDVYEGLCFNQAQWWGVAVDWSGS
ncbi:MAG TPA: zinc-binding dehydrogenase [Abditibacteriaceae bacterium]|nr:zinc-binding dehydrogenase [Abditibacteriaceae bacterium]